MAFVKKLVIQGFKSFAPKTEIPFDKGINVIIGPNGSGKSCSYDTIVQLSNGSEIEIGKLIEDQVKKSNNIKNLDDGIYVDGDNSLEVLSLNKITMKSEKKKISKFIKREGDYLYLIKTKSGRELKATKCHPIMSFSNGEVKSKIISELDKGSFIATPRVIETDSNKQDIEFSRLIGYIIGDGYIAKDRIEFVNKDPEILKDFEELILKYSKWGIRKRDIQSTTRIYCRDRELYSKIRNLYNLDMKTITSENKVIPNYFLSLNKQSVSNLLAGLFDTDGSVRKNLPIIEYCTKNKILARQVQSLLLRFGINSKIKKRIAFAYNTSEKKKSDYYYIYIYGIENIRRFYDNIPLRVDYKRNNLKELILKNTIPNNNLDLLPKEINLFIKEISKLLGIKVKNIKKEYPILSAYVEDRCSPSRQGVRKILPLFNQKFAILNEKFNSLQDNPKRLIEFMDSMNLSSREASESIGLHKTLIRNQWQKELYTPRQNNLMKFKDYLNQLFLLRNKRISEILILLKNISNSDIYWDEIISIEKLEKPDFVYDLTIEGNHNFIANNLFAHNSNVSDALCFVLGRLSIKSMRAAKASNLLFQGSNERKPSHEASVEIVFDNHDRTFPIDAKEISIKRIVRRNGLSIYKINDTTKTRQEIIELLAQAGIDPNGFNIVLQGEIARFIKMRSEERREIIEEVAGISIYESRKQKALNEIEKTEQKLKEVASVLRERTAYLRNLEQERKQALRFKELEKTIKQCKATLIKKNIDEKTKEISNVDKEVEKNKKYKDSIKKQIDTLNQEISQLEERINEINQYIQKTTGFERESLNEEITALNVKIASDSARRENFDKRLKDNEVRKRELESNFKEMEQELLNLRKKTPSNLKKHDDLKKKKETLEEIGEDREKLYNVQIEINSIKSIIKDKIKNSERLESESKLVFSQIRNISESLLSKSIEECKSDMHNIKSEIESIEKHLSEILTKKITLEKSLSVLEDEKNRNQRLKEHMPKADTCPLCQTKLTKEHTEHVVSDANKKITKSSQEISNIEQDLIKINNETSNYNKRLSELKTKHSEKNLEIIRLNQIEEKKDHMKKLMEEEKSVKSSIENLENELKKLEKKLHDKEIVEEKYERLLFEIQEISSRTEENVDTTILYKERELENVRNVVKNIVKDKSEIESELKSILENLKENQKKLNEKEKASRELAEKFKKLFDERSSIQEKIKNKNTLLINHQTGLNRVEDSINNYKVSIAGVSASKESLEFELKEFHGIEFLQASKASIEERLSKLEQEFMNIGSVNLRALETYDAIKEEYDKIAEKATQLENERDEILKIIHEIDIKKKKTFMKTFTAINELFTKNFSELSVKGKAFLEIENPEDIFEGGISITIKVAKGKYFDVTSLSGGEQTLVALSLIFSIQEFKPYAFYILDEIDAALDKRNAELLANLLKKYIKSGQYIIISHNDSIISGADVIYGVSMNNGVSKILSLEVREKSQ